MLGKCLVSLSNRSATSCSFRMSALSASGDTRRTSRPQIASIFTYSAMSPSGTFFGFVLGLAKLEFVFFAGLFDALRFSEFPRF